MWPISTPRASSSGPEPSGAGVPRAHLGDVDHAVGCEVAARDEVDDVVVGDVGAGHPRRTVDDPRVDQVPDAARRLLAQHRLPVLGGPM
jgi:hypothetical protein